MNDKEKIATIRELCEESLKANESCRIFLKALLENQWLFYQGAQIRLLIEEIESVSKHANLVFIPEIIN